MEAAVSSETLVPASILHSVSSCNTLIFSYCQSLCLIFVQVPNLSKYKMTVYMRWIHPPSHFSGKYLYRTCLILCYSYHAFLYVQYIDQEILEYIKMCIWYNPENYDIWQPFGPGGSGYHNFYWYLHRIAFISHFCFNFSHVGFVALCTLQLF